MKPVDQSAAADVFIADVQHERFHDHHLWDLRKGRDQERDHIPEWETLRQLASDIKAHTLTHLADYLEEFERNATANGVQVHWAQDAQEHNRIVGEIFAARQVKTVIKSKSMLTDECQMRPYLAERGITVIESDLGERIQQLDDDQPPSHIVVPAVHKLRGDVAKLFARTINSDPNNDDPKVLSEAGRQSLRPHFLAADAGMTGANYLIAETGSFVVCTNEGNADISANLPPLHVASVGIEKLIPRIEDLGVFIRLLSRSALGSPITQYTSHFRAPRDGGEMHIVLVDNGRSARLGMADFWTSLKCIRCGACMNTCPVYRRSGGLSYGSVYPGPIGVILNPAIDLHRYRALPYASTMNGSCTSVCPVKINIHEQIYQWRRIISEKQELPLLRRGALDVAAKVLASPALFRRVIAGVDQISREFPRALIYNPLNAWGLQREIPDAPKATFHQWWAKNRGADHE
ncbi:lactate utilization protein B [Deefgea piscis]|uniref:lactate utilization protein B n=1 Tax=Deefgea piscis TaxID=2739061 RepID=UPI001C802623|nr:lactate utilization protein B [Deefgea piscis]QZA80144.1 lactate utilization protein [Deefgea piscis]